MSRFADVAPFIDALQQSIDNGEKRRKALSVDTAINEIMTLECRMFYERLTLDVLAGLPEVFTWTPAGVLPPMHDEPDGEGGVFRLSDDVLVACEDGTMEIAKLDVEGGRNWWVDRNGTVLTVTHWMALPPLPKEDACEDA
ncbi:MAG: hypothetical protein IJT18_08045 [Oscillospiraceae bacterium]|nr:hypothetical protein [Oscillospiraceae bacterium]